METKFCSGCALELTVDKFRRYKSGPRVGKVIHQCIECFKKTCRKARNEMIERRPLLRTEIAQKMRDKRKESPKAFREADRRSYAKLRAKIDMLKAERGCYDCGGMFRDNPSILEWDHLPGKEKLFGIGARMKSFGLERTLEEVSKCQVVCANCHRIRTDSRKGELV